MTEEANGEPRKRRVAAWTMGTIAGVLLLLVIVLALLDWNALRGPISRYASRHLHRPVAINGDLKVHLISLAPRVEVNGLVIGAPDWEKPRNMVQADRIGFRVRLFPLFVGRLDFDSLRIEHALIYLHRSASGTSNWQLTQTVDETSSNTPVRLPVIRRLLIDDSHIDLSDEQRHLQLSSSVKVADRSKPSADGALVAAGNGSLNAKPFAFHLRGDSLLEMQADRPYDFGLSLNAGEITASVKGRAERAFDFAKVGAHIQVSGEDLADLYYLAGLALPNTPAYQVSVDLVRDGMHVDLKSLSGRLGTSDIEGELAVDLGGRYPRLTGAVASKELDLADLAAPLGTNKKAATTISSTDRTQKPPPPDNLLLPDATLQVNRVRGMNADVYYRAATVHTQKIQLRKVALHIQLQDGVLSLRPAAVEFPMGSLNAAVRIDARTDTPRTDLDIRITGVNLEQFSKPGTTAPLSGTLEVRAKIRGDGKSVHELAADSNGSVTMVIPHGEIRQAFAELTGINVDRGVGLILFNAHQTTSVRCGVANFEITDGRMEAKNVVIDTDDVLITASGDIQLNTEKLDLNIKGQPKKLRLIRLRSPILVRGDLKKPTVGVDVGKTALQAGVAAALGTLLTPLGAVIAFVDPGLAKNADCSSLLAEAENKVVSPKGPAIPNAPGTPNTPVTAKPTPSRHDPGP